MHLKSLYLKNFRVYKESVFHFSPSINLIEGPNAQGKTTILEAIHLLMTGRSFRTQTLSDLIKTGESGFVVEASFEKHGIEQSLRFAFDGKEKSIFYNHTPCRNLTALFGLLQGAISLPDDIQLIKGAPKGRRRFLDLQLAQIDPLYVHHLSRYYRALMQRNHLLKTKQGQMLEVFEVEMGRSAAYIVQKRKEAVDQLVSICQEVQKSLSSGTETIFLRYQPRFESAEKWIAQYQSLRGREMQFGTTLVGPHKEDLSLYLGEQEVKTHASEGQKKSMAIALRFAEWKHLKGRCETDPLMLIDDLGASLDRERQERLLLLLKGFQQVLITSTDSLKLNGVHLIHCNTVKSCTI